MQAILNLFPDSVSQFGLIGCAVDLALWAMVALPLVALGLCIRYADRNAWLLGIAIMSFVIATHALLHWPPFN